jgi:hypothetical protein
MKKNIPSSLKKIITTLVFFLFAMHMAGQDKILFVKQVPIKLKSDVLYKFVIGYDVLENRDISVEITGGRFKFWAEKIEPVVKGKGIIQVTLKPESAPPVGSGYRLIAAIRESGGDWKKTIASSIINNLQITDNVEPVTDDANFDPLTKNSVPSDDFYDFDVNYIASKMQLLTVAVWDDNKWMGASEIVEVAKGSGTKRLRVSMGAHKEGKKYKFTLYYGTGEKFPDENLTSKEMTGVEITKKIKMLTLPELAEKSITMVVNSNLPKVNLPGNLKFESIKIIGLDGKVIKEAKDTNSIFVADLPQGPYFIVTSNDDYYKFVKN